MRTVALRASALLSLGLLFTACSSDPPAGNSDAGTAAPDAAPLLPDAATSTDAAIKDAGTYTEPTDCKLVNDTGGPGQYADSCVLRAWIKDYAGTYKSPNCELTIDVSGGTAAAFRVKVTGGELPGTYSNDWEGGTGVGNDSYYRFTTDATYATTKTLNFAAGRKLSETDESTISFRVEGLDTATPTFTGYYAEFKNGKDTTVQCGSYVKQ